jgi:tape measure domain-containing protein
MAADGGTTFSVALLNDVTRPSKAIVGSLNEVKRAFDRAKSAAEAPSPRKPLGSADPMAKARLSLARDTARQQAQIVKLNALDQVRAQKAVTKQAKVVADKQIKEQKRVADFRQGMAQQKLDQRMAVGGMVGGAALGATAAVALAGVAATAAVGMLAVKFGEAAVQAAAFGERSRMALTFLIGSSGQANEQFDSLRKEAAGLGLDVERTQHSFQKLIAAQFSVGKSRELVRMGADLQAIGANAEDVEGVLLAMTQIKSKNKLQAEEMLQLQERGISAELVYAALGKQLGKTREELDKMQRLGQIKGDPAIEAIIGAVKAKTGVTNTGDAGKTFADTSITGMTNVMLGRFKNFMIDVGDAILPGLTTLVGLVKGTFDAIEKDPKIAAIGKTLLAKFDYFVLWVEAEWPTISGALVGGLELVGNTFVVMTELIDVGTLKGKAFVGVLGILAAVLGVAALGAFTLMLPLYLLIGVIGLVAYGIYKAVMWVVDAIASLAKWVGGGDKASAGPVPTTATGGGFDDYGLTGPGSETITTAADSGPAARVSGVLGSYTPEPVTVASVEQTPAGPQNTFDFSGMQVGANVDQDDLVAKIRSQVTKAIQEAA